MKKLIIAVLVAVMFAGCVVATAAPQDFLDKMAPVAQEIVPGYGLWPSVFLAQAALESGWGRSWLAVNANNYFGRKCLQLPCIEIKTPEYRKGQRMIEEHSFQIYESLTDAVHGYCQQFFRKYASGAAVYPELDASTPESFIRSVAPRYATDPRYAEKVLKIIDEWGLRSWDAK
jgi:flagellum-specific peptidoglycan hydrolase FlgJ